MRDKITLTDRFAKTAEAGLHFDHHKDAPRGFLLRVTPGLSRAWCLDYRLRDSGRQRRITIGDVAAWPVSEARKHAAELRRAVDAGGDPLADRETKRQEPTVSELWDRFSAEALPSRAPRTQAEYRAMARDWILPAIGKLKVTAVGRQDVEKLHHKVTAAGKGRRANSVKSLTSTLFQQAITWNMRADNPATHVKGNTEHRHERFMSPEELERLMVEIERHRALGGHWIDSADKTELAVYTGARRGEILGMRWPQIENLDGSATWILPSRSTKEGKRTGRIKRLPLSEGAVAVLRRRRDERKVVQIRDDHVFRGGDTKLSANELEGDWYVIRAAAGLEDVRFHDLRHSFASFAVAQGLSLEIIGKLLGHAQAATTQRYAHLADAPLRAATEKVSSIVRRPVK